MKAIHLICKRNDAGSLRNLSHEGRLSRSGFWDMSEQDAAQLVGGWLYLHETKARPSEFGGRIVDYEPTAIDGVARPDRVMFVVERSRDGKGRAWRGASHGMAHSGGLVAAELPHERGSDLTP